MLSLIFERSAFVWVRDEYAVAHLGGKLIWRTINVGGFGAWLLTWVDDEMNICTWWRFVLDF